MTTGTLYPRESETREVRSLDGLWNFVKSDITNPTQGMRDKWYLDDLSRVRKTIPMPVPASYNDITTEHAIRDHVGTVWYDRKFFVPMSWSKNQRVWLRFGSVHYEAFVYINGEMVVRHEMGHLPFEAEISQYVKYGQENRITVMCDNALIQTTIPQGKITELARYLDILSFNRYIGWNGIPERLDMITKRIIDEATTWHEKHNKPVIMSEYGADTVEGLHLLPSYVWSEEYQTELFSRHFRAFDILRKKSWFIGEFVWNFADFKTAQSVTRVGGNKKGVFTRSRQPKAVAHLLRKRYFALGRELDMCDYTSIDLLVYITNSSQNGDF
uniref:Glycoside hydrolase family 2 catalytic domain-containing protein n=1 Tax=Glossina palpalis gambiensis TaxID=67801 RepID=A0A1B0ARG6_9MUSC